MPAAWKLVCRFLFSSFLGDGEEVPVPFLLGEGAQLRLVLEGLGEGHLGVLGHELGDVVRVLEGDVEGPSHVLYDRLRLERAEGEDLPRAVRAVLARHVVDHLAAALDSRSRCRSRASISARG